MADAIAGTSEDVPAGGAFPIFHCNSEDVHAALTLAGTWQWAEGAAVFDGSLRKRTQQGK